MDSAEKIKVFNSFEDLTRAIIQDKDSGDMLAQQRCIEQDARQAVLAHHLGQFAVMHREVEDG